MPANPAPAAKVDLKTTLAGYSARRGRFDLINLPPRRYLMIDGAGDPNTAGEYAEALATLYPAAYALKFLSKTAQRDYVVPPLEALWWADDFAAFTSARDKSQWKWTLLNVIPEWVSDAQVADAVASATAKGAPRAHALRIGELAEGLCVQTLHLGSYDNEGPVLEELHARVIPGHGLALTGTHHEIYLSDPRRTAPEKLKTILRQPVTRTPA